MASSLDNIFDDELAPPSPLKHISGDETDGHSASRRSRKTEALFLADSDDEDVAHAHTSTRPIQTAPPAQNIDVDAHFENLDDDDDDLFTFKRLEPAVDEEAVRREAEERHRRNTAPLTPHEVMPSSSPPRDTDAGNKGREGTRDEGKDGQKEQRKPIRLDEGRLLGPNGFPQLIKDTKNFRIKGKGHEATDLNRILQVYQFWTQRLYPKTQFRDTVERVEKLCHSRRMNVALSVWRDEAHGKKPSNANDSDEDIIDLTEKDPEDDNEASGAGSAPDSDAVAYAPSSPAEASRPPSSASEFEDDFDIDAIIQAEADSAPGAHDAPAGPARQPVPQRGRPQTAPVDEDEEMWNMFNEEPSAPLKKSTEKSKPPVLEDEHEEMWSMFNDDPPAPARSLAPRPPPATLTSRNRNSNGDEDEEMMWDLVREMEGESTPADKLPAPAPPSEPVASTAPPTIADEDDDNDMEDMYL